jgi:hypothetical protein
MNDEAFMEQVADHLRSVGVNAVSWNSGDEVFGVGIAAGTEAPDELSFFFGTAAENWAGERFGVDGEESLGVLTDVPSGETDSAKVARGILVALAAELAS